MKKDNKTPNEANPENPYKTIDLKLTKVKDYAAGIPALKASLNDLIEEKTLLRGGKALFKMNQMGGFDCPSCAWPDPDDERSPLGEYCENGVKALAEEATSKKITADFFKNHSVYELSQLSDYEIGKKGRLTEPMYLPKNGTHYQPISWENAFQKIAQKLNELDSPNEAIFYTSGRTSNEASFLYQLFAKEFGTNNMPDCSNMCHETSGTALRPTIGIGKGTVKLEDFYDTDVIVIIGQNPGTNAPRMLSALEKGKKNGAKIIAINPLPEAGLMGFKNPQEVKGIIGSPVKLADLYLPVKINGDMALLKAIEMLLIEYEKKNPGKILDQQFIHEKTTGFDTYFKQFETYDFEQFIAESGVSKEAIQQAAEMIAFKNRIIIC